MRYENLYIRHVGNILVTDAAIFSKKLHLARKHTSCPLKNLYIFYNPKRKKNLEQSGIANRVIFLLQSFQNRKILYNRNMGDFMKKFLTLLFVIIGFTQSFVYCGETTERDFKVVQIKDTKTDAEIARTVIPKNFDAKYDVIWAKDFEQPLYYTVTAKSGETFFFYSSPKTYVQDVSQNEEIKKGKIDSVIKVTRKKYSSPEDFILELVHSTNPEAKDIELVSSKPVSDEMLNYLNGEILKKAEAIQQELKSDRKSSMANVTDATVKPCTAVYSYKIKDKTYKQMFITMFVSVDIDLTKKTGYDEYNTITKKLWTNTGFYSYRALKDDFDKGLDDFMVFAANTVPNQKVVSAVNTVKKQMVMELSPFFVDINSGSSLKNMPSELFRKYYTGGMADYSEENALNMPVINNSRWLIETLSPQNCFTYRNVSSVFKQKFHAPQKYKYAYYNPIEKTIVFNMKKVKPDFGYIKLK